MVKPLIFTKIELNILKRMLNFKRFESAEYFLNNKTILDIKSTKLNRIPEKRLVVSKGWLLGRFTTGEVTFPNDIELNLRQIVDLNHRFQYFSTLIDRRKIIETLEVKVEDGKGRVSKKGIQVHRIKQDKTTFVKIWLYFLNYSNPEEYYYFLSSDYFNRCKSIFNKITREFDKIVPNNDKLKPHFLSAYLRNPKEFSNSYKIHIEKRRKLKKQTGGKLKK
jgi:hypothetical protein